MKLILNVSYSYDDNKYWQDSYLKNTIVTIDETKGIHEQIKKFIKNSDYIQFTKSTGFQPMFRDTKEWDTKPAWYIYRIYNEDNRKTYRGDCWVWIEWIVTDYAFNDITK